MEPVSPLVSLNELRNIFCDLRRALVAYEQPYCLSDAACKAQTQARTLIDEAEQTVETVFATCREKNPVSMNRLLDMANALYVVRARAEASGNDIVLNWANKMMKEVALLIVSKSTATNQQAVQPLERQPKKDTPRGLMLARVKNSCDPRQPGFSPTRRDCI